MSSNTIQQLDESPTVQPHRARGGQKANKNAETHGHYRRKLKLSGVSFADINASSAGGQQLFERRDELIKHAGGDEHVSAVTVRLIEEICFAEYQLLHLNLYLAQLGAGIVNKRSKTLAPIALQRDAMLNTLTKLYDALGYQPTTPPAPTLQDYIRAYDAKRAQPQQPSPSSSPAPKCVPEPTSPEIPASDAAEVES